MKLNIGQPYLTWGVDPAGRGSAGVGGGADLGAGHVGVTGVT